MAYLYNGTTLRVGRAWTDVNGVTHPRNWASAWSDEDKAAVGIIWEDEPAAFDNRFYWDANTPKALEDSNAVDAEGNPVLDEDGVQLVNKGLKTAAIAQTKVTAGGLLQPTDWMVIKAAEVEGYSVPSEVFTYRAAVRAASNSIEAAITACGTLEEFIGMYDAPVDAEGNPTGNAPINDWPEAI